MAMNQAGYTGMIGQGAAFGDLSYAQSAKEVGLVEDLSEVVIRIVKLADLLDTTADRISGPELKRASPVGIPDQAGPVVVNLASTIRHLKIQLDRAEAEMLRISNAL